MRVLWFTNTSSCYRRDGSPANCYNGGGWISSLETELRKRDDVELGICFYTNLVSEAKKEEQDGTTYYLLPRPKKSLRYVLETIIEKPEKSTWKHEKLAVPALVSVVDDFNPDVIQVFGSENIYGLIVSYVKVPVVLHIQGILTTYLNSFLPPFVSWHMYLWQDKSIRNVLQRISDRIAWKRNSLTEKRMMSVIRNFMGRTVWDERIAKLLNPEAQYYHCDEILRDVFYDVRSEQGLPYKPTFTTTISSQLYKGYDIVLKVAKILKDMAFDFEWKVFGDIHPAFIEKICEVKHDDVNVRLMGVASAEQIKDELLHSTAYIHTSYVDNSPNSLCEALLLGVPSIANNVGGISSLVDDGQTGFLVPANDPYQMAFLMKYLAEHSEVNIEMGKRARQVAMKRHDRKMIVERVMEIYKDILLRQETDGYENS